MAASRHSFFQEPGFQGPPEQTPPDRLTLHHQPAQQQPPQHQAPHQKPSNQKQRHQDQLDQVPLLPIQGVPAGKGQLASRRQRIRTCLALVAPISRHYASVSRESADDLTQVGLLGLLRAAELFVPSRGEPFEPFARQHIRGAILHYLRDQSPLVRIPRRRQELEQQRRRCESRLLAERGHTPSPEAVRQAMGLSQGQWQRLAATPAGHRFVPLDEGEGAPAPEQELDGPEDPRGARALALLDQLPPQQAEAIKAVILSGRSLRQVASDRGMSASTVHRQLHRGLAELRRRLAFPSDAVAC